MNQPKPHVLIISNNVKLAYNTLACLATDDYKVFIMGPWGRSVYHLSRYLWGYDRIDPQDLADATPAFVARVNEVCRLRKIDWIVPADMTAAHAILTHHDTFDAVKIFPMPTHQQFMQMHDKWQFSQVTTAAGATHPTCRLMQSPDDATPLDIDYPLIVKPLDQTGSIGVYLIRNSDQLTTHLRQCQQTGQLPQLAQQYIEGYELDVTVLADHGKIVAWTIQKRDVQRGAVEFMENEPVLEQIRRIVSHIRYHGIIDFDVQIHTATQMPFVIEANPRFPGSLLFKFWAGVNFPALGLAMAQGQDISQLFTPANGHGINTGISPKRLLKALLRGHLIPPQFSENSRRSWQMHYHDLPLHLLLWLKKTLRPQPVPTWHLAGELPIAQQEKNPLAL